MRTNVFSKIDFPLFACLLGIITYGLLVLYSASGGNYSVVFKQCINVILGLSVMTFASNIKPQTYRDIAPIIYIIGVIFLILVLVIGSHAKGAQRWLNLGFFKFQPAEMMKFGVPIMLAWFFHPRSLPPKFIELCVGLILLAVPAALIIKQPDLGSGLLVAASGIYIIFFAQLSWKLIFTAVFGVIASLPIAWGFLHDYQRQRVITFLNPESDPLGSGYHIIQSKIAIGSGGLWGKGFMAGTQSQLHFLPERTTDFIFAVLAEEFGFVGVCLLLILYMLVLYRGFEIAMRCTDTFSRLLAGALVLTFFTYIFVNIGMVCGILPVVGVPLPLVSNGGTAMISLLGAFGVLMALGAPRRLMSY